MVRPSEKNAPDPRRFTLRELSAVTSYAESIIGRKVSNAGVPVATDWTITSAAAREALSLHDTEARDLKRLSRMGRGQRASWVDGALEARPPATDPALPDTGPPEPVDPTDAPAATSPRLTTRQRRENRLALRRDWMDKRINSADADFERSRAAVEGIEPGQPILVGHHSERKHRRAVERSHDAMRRAMDSNRMATRHGFAASALERELERSIYHDDRDATQQLETRIAEREITRDRVKSANQRLRQLVKTVPAPSDDQLLALGFIADEIATIRSRQANLNRPTLDVYPFLNLVTADIARNKKRLANIRKSKTSAVVASPKPAREELLEHVGRVSDEMERTQEIERRSLLLRLQAGETVTNRELKAIGYRPWQIERLREQDWSEWKPGWARGNYADSEWKADTSQPAAGSYHDPNDPALDVSDALTSETVVTGYAPLDAPAIRAVEEVAPDITASVTGEVLELSQAVVDGSQHARRRALTLQEAATEVKSAAKEVRLHTANATALADEAKALMAEDATLEPVAETGGGAPGSAGDGSGGEGKPHESEPPATNGGGDDQPETPQFQVTIANANLKALSAVEAAEAAQDLGTAALAESQKATIALERLNFAWAQLQEMSAAANAKAQAIDTDPDSISAAETYAAEAQQALASVEPDVQLANQLVAEARKDALTVVARADVIAADNRAAASAIGQAAEQGRAFDLVKVYHGTHAEFDQLEPQLMVGASRPMTFTSDSFPLASGYGVGGRVIEGYILDDGAIPIVRMPMNYAGNAPIIRYPAGNYDDASVFVLHTPDVFHQGAEHRWDPELLKWGLAPRPALPTSPVLPKPKRTRGYKARVAPKSAGKASAAPHPWLRTNELR